MEKVICNCCSNKYVRRYMILRSGIYSCGCGYAISQKYYKGEIPDDIDN